ncbi:hypothetical protein JTE90_011107 [Oedothorax gibbosus]|uniref:RING-type domain-containing protein n=1 Tax=Oedothorax gibbosus TaxID=931172 RepID=A0AAV6UEW1_9ARAC|nr:hypothetical protein JTE90_011107 [Oedothorax gibbosus]
MVNIIPLQLSYYSYSITLYTITFVNNKHKSLPPPIRNVAYWNAWRAAKGSTLMDLLTYSVVTTTKGGRNRKYERAINEFTITPFFSPVFPGTNSLFECHETVAHKENPQTAAATVVPNREKLDFALFDFWNAFSRSDDTSVGSFSIHRSASDCASLQGSGKMPRRGLDALVFPGKFLVDKIAGLKKQQQEHSRRKVTERELAHLHHKIDKLLVRLEEHEPEQAQTQDEECAICISAKATMQTFPCGHRVVCRKCFVKTIQMAVSQRLLPLRCVICRAKILRLKQTSPSSKNNHPQLTPDPLLLANRPTCRRQHHLAIKSISRQPNHQGLLNHYHQKRHQFKQRMNLKSLDLLAIPESEELDLVNAVQDRAVLDFNDEEEEDEENEWPKKMDLELDGDKNKKDLVKGADHFQVVKWLSKFRRFRPHSILKGIRNRWIKVEG